jgi:hypothetical protein
MPKIYATANRVRIHTGEWWRKYKKQPEQFKAFRIQDVGRPGYSQRIAVQLDDGRWVNYGWSFSKEQVELIAPKTLLVKDQKALEILMKLKAEGELKGYKIIAGKTPAEIRKQLGLRQWKLPQEMKIT